MARLETLNCCRTWAQQCRRSKASSVDLARRPPAPSPLLPAGGVTCAGPRKGAVVDCDPEAITSSISSMLKAAQGLEPFAGILAATLELHRA